MAISEMIHDLSLAMARLSRGRAGVGPHITRYVLYRHLQGVIEREQSQPVDRLLAIGESVGLAEAIGLRADEVVAADFPDHDMLSLRFESESFGAVVSDQVLEHVHGDPFQAVAETLRVVRVGGLVVHTTCFINPVHGHPGDFWRFTPEALQLMVRGQAAVIDAGGWGNRGVWLAIAAGMRFEPVPHAPWHPLHRLAVSDNPAWPIVTWIVARRTSQADSSGR